MPCVAKRERFRVERGHPHRHIYTSIYCYGLANPKATHIPHRWTMFWAEHTYGLTYTHTSCSLRGVGCTRIEPKELYIFQLCINACAYGLRLIGFDVYVYTSTRNGNLTYAEYTAIPINTIGAAVCLNLGCVIVSICWKVYIIR